MILIPFSIQRLYILENLETKKEKKKTALYNSNSLK